MQHASGNRHTRRRRLAALNRRLTPPAKALSALSGLASRYLKEERHRENCFMRKVMCIESSDEAWQRLNQCRRLVQSAARKTESGSANTCWRHRDNMGTYNNTVAVVTCPRCVATTECNIELFFGNTSQMVTVPLGSLYPFLSGRAPQNGDHRQPKSILVSAMQNAPRAIEIFTALPKCRTACLSLWLQTRPGCLMFMIVSNQVRLSAPNVMSSIHRYAFLMVSLSGSSSACRKNVPM